MGDDGLDSYDPEQELAQLDMAYRHYVEFVAGHGTAVHAVTGAEEGEGGDPTRAVRLETRAVPVYEVPRTEAPTAQEEPALGHVVLDMKSLATLADASIRSAL